MATESIAVDASREGANGMRRRRKHLVSPAIPLVLAALLLMVAAGCSGDDAAESTVRSTTTEAEAGTTAVGSGGEARFLYSVSGGGGTLEPDADGLALTITEVDSHTIAFADRPVRAAQVIGTARLAERWDAAFGDDPPNAVLTELGPEAGEPDSTVLTLTDPSYDVTSATLRFRATLVPDADVPDRLRGVGGQRRSEAPETFDAVSLFIDDAPANDLANGSGSCDTPILSENDDDCIPGWNPVPG